MPCNNGTSPTYQPIDAIKDLEMAIRAAQVVNSQRRDEMRHMRHR